MQISVFMFLMFSSSSLCIYGVSVEEFIYSPLVLYLIIHPRLLAFTRYNLCTTINNCMHYSIFCDCPEYSKISTDQWVNSNLICNSRRTHLLCCTKYANLSCLVPSVSRGWVCLLVQVMYTAMWLCYTRQEVILTLTNFLFFHDPAPFTRRHPELSSLLSSLSPASLYNITHRLLANLCQLTHFHNAKKSNCY